MNNITTIDTLNEGYKNSFKYKKALEGIQELVSGNYEILDPLAKQKIENIVRKALNDNRNL